MCGSSEHILNYFTVSFEHRLASGGQRSGSPTIVHQSICLPYDTSSSSSACRDRVWDRSFCTEFGRHPLGALLAQLDDRAVPAAAGYVRKLITRSAGAEQHADVDGTPNRRVQRHDIYDSDGLQGGGAPSERALT